MSLQEFVVERDQALLSLDATCILAFAKKHGIRFPSEDHPAFWIAVHKARTGATRLPESARQHSIDWLSERGFDHFADDLAP